MQQADLNKLYFLARSLDVLPRKRKGKVISEDELETLCIQEKTSDLTVTTDHHTLEDIAEKIREIVLGEEEKGGRHES